MHGMTSAASAPLTLALVDDDPPAAAPTEQEAGIPEALRDLRINDADAMLAAVLDECAAGKVDRALWTHSVTQAAGDDALAAPLYLRARATAIRLERRSQRPEGSSGENEPREGARRIRPRSATAASVPAQPAAPPAPAARPLRHEAARRAAGWKLVAAGGALAVIASAAAVAWIAYGGDDGASASSVRAAARPKATLSGNVVRPVKAAPAASSEPSFEQRVAELEQAGNWNVLVLYATEWARKEPGNGHAWHKLAQGYVKLGQLPEAAEASAKAVQLAPADVAVWADAAAVYAALERWPQARAAYERVLATAPADTRALCGAALVARREGRFADAEGFTGRASGAGSACTADGAQGVAASAAVPSPRGRR